jgi:hypothetical protein
MGIARWVLCWDEQKCSEPWLPYVDRMRSREVEKQHEVFDLHGSGLTRMTKGGCGTRGVVFRALAALSSPPPLNHMKLVNCKRTMYCSVSGVLGTRCHDFTACMGNAARG